MIDYRWLPTTPMSSRLVTLILLSCIVLGALTVVADSNPVIHASPSISIIVYPDSSIVLAYSIIGVLEAPTSISGGHVDCILTYTRTTRDVELALTGGLEVNLYGIPSGEPRNQSIFFLGASLSLEPRTVNSSYLSGMILIDLVERHPNVTAHSIVNVSRLVANLTPDTLRASFTVELKGENISILEVLLKQNASTLNKALVEKGLDWIKFTQYSIEQGNHTYRIIGLIEANYTRLLQHGLKEETLSEEQKREVEKCLVSLSNPARTRVRVAQSVWAEEYSNSMRIGSKTEAQIRIEDNNTTLRTLVGELGRCLPLLNTVFPVIGVNVSSPPLDLTSLQDYTRIPGLVEKTPYTMRAHTRIEFTEENISFNISVTTGRLEYPNKILPVSERIERTARIVKEYLENLTAILEPYRLLLGVEHLIPLDISIVGAESGNLRVVVEPNRIELFKPLKLHVEVVETTPTNTTITQPTRTVTKTMTYTVTTTIEKTKTITETITSTKTITETINHTVTITHSIEGAGVETIILSIIALTTVIVVVYFIVRGKTKR